LAIIALLGMTKAIKLDKVDPVIGDINNIPRGKMGE
jgi:hypothetical protein